MNPKKWLLFATALLLIAGGAAFLLHLRSKQSLGQPGVRLTRTGGGWTVALPETVLDFTSKPIDVTDVERDALPKDTTFGKRLYAAPDDFAAFVNVVLMGTDRTSIHKPQFCLAGQGWTIDRTERASIRITEPFPYDLPVMKLTLTKQVADARGQPVTVRGIFLYWFVADGRLTSEHWQRMWWMAQDLVRTGVLQRWAYVICFSTCYQGQEQDTFERMERFLAAGVPQFQRTAGPPAIPLQAAGF